jgi:acyl carrier protein
VSEADKGYELEILKKIVNKYLDESTLFNKKNINESEAERDQFVWDTATKIYQQSGHKVELSLVRDAVNSRIDVIKCQLAEEKKRIIAEEAHRVAEEARQFAEKRCIAERQALRIAEKDPQFLKKDPQFLKKVTESLGKFGGNEGKAKVFVRVRKIISEQLAVEENEVSLDSHLSNHLNADGDDLIGLVMALEEEFGIEIPDDSEHLFDIYCDIDSLSWWRSGSSSSPTSSTSTSLRYYAGEECIVRNFVELICTEFSD